jgi:hypothetical protein
MSSPPLRGGNGLAALRAAKVAHSRRTSFAATRPRSLLFLSIGFSVLLGLCLLAVAVHEFARPAATNATADNNAHSGKIVIRAARGDGCQQRRFDNRTGRVTHVSVSCEGPEFDDNGRPIPRGTIGRLNQIGKSFQDR